MRKGSIVAGKLADLVVFARDPLTVPLADLPTVPAELTMIGGQIVHRSAASPDRTRSCFSPTAAILSVHPITPHAAWQLHGWLAPTSRLSWNAPYRQRREKLFRATMVSGWAERGID